MTQTAPIAVLDSSVLVARWSRLALQLIASRSPMPYTPVWSEWIIAETWRVLATKWHSRAGTPQDNEVTLSRAANQMMRLFIPVMQLVSLRDASAPPPWPELRDPDDHPVWQTAVVAKANFVVSHNLSDFPPLVAGRHSHLGIEYLTATEFIENVLRISLESVTDTEAFTSVRPRSLRNIST